MRGKGNRGKGAARAPGSCFGGLGRRFVWFKVPLERDIQMGAAGGWSLLVQACPGWKLRLQTGRRDCSGDVCLPAVRVSHVFA